MTPVITLSDYFHSLLIFLPDTIEKREIMMTREIRIGLFLLLLLIPPGLSAQELSTLTIEDSIDAALKQNRDMIVTNKKTESVRKSFDNRWNSLIPGITASTSLEYKDYGVSEWTNSEAPSRGNPINFGGSLSLSLPLNTGLAYKIEKTRIDYEASLISSETARKQLIRDVEKEFYNLLASQTNLDILKKNRDLAEKRYQQTLNNYKNGFASELKVLQAQVSAANTVPTLSQAVSDYDTRLRSFLVLLGMDPEMKVKITGNLNRPVFKPDEKELLNRFLASRRDIQAQKKEIESLKNSAQLTKAAGFSPSLTLSGGWSTSVNDPFTGGSWGSDSWTDSLSMGMSLRIPLDGYIPGSQQSTALQQSEDKIEQAQITLESITDKAKSEILNLIQQINTALDKIDQAQLNVNLSRHSFEMTEESYNQGATERLDVEDAQQSYLKAVQQQLDSRYQYLTALINLKYALDLDSLDELFKLDTTGEKSNG